MRRVASRPVLPQDQPSEIETPAADSLSTNLEEMLTKLTACLSREVANLTKETVAGPLEKDRSAALIQYVKLLSDMKKTKAKEGDAMTDAELEKIAAQAENK